MSSIANDIEKIKEAVLLIADSSVKSDLSEKLKIMERVEGLTKTERVKEAQKLTCWGNMAYCCAVSKGCPWLLATLKACGISHNKYTSIKEGLDWYTLSRN